MFFFQILLKNDKMNDVNFETIFNSTPQAARGLFNNNEEFIPFNYIYPKESIDNLTQICIELNCKGTDQDN